MRKLKVIFFFGVFFCFFSFSHGQSPQVSGKIDNLTILINVVDCETRMPLPRCQITYDYYNYGESIPIVGTGIRTDSNGNLTLTFDGQYVGHTVYYRIDKTDYWPDSGSFILKPGTRLSVCLRPMITTEPEKVVEERPPFIFNVSAKDSTGLLLDSVIVSYVFQDQKSNARCEIKDTLLLTDSSYSTDGKVSFQLPSACVPGNPITYSIVKRGFQPQRGEFSLSPNELVSTYYLVPKPAKIKPCKCTLETISKIVGVVGTIGLMIYGVEKAYSNNK